MNAKKMSPEKEEVKKASLELVEIEKATVPSLWEKIKKAMFSPKDTYADWERLEMRAPNRSYRGGDYPDNSVWRNF